MTDHHNQPPFKPLPMWLAMTLTATAVLSVCLLVANAINDSTISRIHISIIAAITFITTIITTLPVVIFGQRGPMPTVAGYLFGTAARMAVCLVTAVIALKVYKVTNAAILLGVAGPYLSLMTVEVAFVGRYLWQKDSLPASADQQLEIQA